MRNSGCNNPASDIRSQRRHVRWPAHLRWSVALCSSAKCQAIDGDPGHVKCTCEGPLQGLNIANSSCPARTDQLTSTFSLWDPTATANKPAKSSLACTGSNAGKWAFCLDAPCSVEKGAVSCRCLLNPASDYYTFIDVCPSDAPSLRAACAEIWSAASQAELLSGFSQLTPFYGNLIAPLRGVRLPRDSRRRGTRSILRDNAFSSVK